MSVQSELLDSAIPAELINQLSYQDVTAEESQKLTGFNLEGWVVAMNAPDGKPYKTSQGKPFYRLKPAKPPEKDGKACKYLSPKGEGCRLYFSPLLTKAICDNADKPITITEGEKKTDSLNAHGFPAIGLSGVDAWRDKRSGDSKPLPEWEDVNLRNRQVFIVYDSDVTVKESVRNALMWLCFWLIQVKEARPFIVLLPCEPNGDRNGVDDFILRHGAAALQSLYAIARSSGQFGKELPPCKLFTWTPEPKESHDKAVTAWAAFDGSYAMRPGFGLYQWATTHWQPANGKGADPIMRPLHLWMDQMHWRKRSTGIMGAIKNELVARLESADWDSPNVMAFTNGTLRHGVFSGGHERSDHQTFCFPFPYDSGAKCPIWHGFIRHALKNQADSINLLRAAIKWSITPKNPDKAFPLELVFDVHGEKGRGKGTLMEVLDALCGGDRGVGIIKSASFSNPNALHGLVGKRIAVDPDASGRISDVGNFNAVASNEPVEVKKMYQDITRARLGVVIWRFFNDTPGASGGGLEGMGRRIVTFRFDNPVTEPDTELKAKLTAEAAGIFWWAWSMSRDDAFTALKNRGQVQAVRDASIDSALERDHTLRFVTSKYPDGMATTMAATFYSEYCEWMKQEGHQPVSKTKFGRDVKKIPWVKPTTDNAGTWYKLTTHTHHELTTHVGLPMPKESAEGVGGELNPPQTQTHHHNPPPSDPPCGNASQGSVVSMVSSPSKNRSLEKEDLNGSKNAYRENFGNKLTKPTTLTTLTITQWVEMAQKAGNKSAAGITSWIKCNGGDVARSEVDRTLKRQEQQSLPLAQ